MQYPPTKKKKKKNKILKIEDAIPNLLKSLESFH